MRIKDGYMLRNVAGSFIVIATGQAALDFTNVINLNEVSAFIWNLLESDITEDEIVKAVVDEYDVDSQTAAKDIHELIVKIDKAGMLDS